MLFGCSSLCSWRSWWRRIASKWRWMEFTCWSTNTVWVGWRRSHLSVWWATSSSTVQDPAWSKTQTHTQIYTAAGFNIAESQRVQLSSLSPYENNDAVIQKPALGHDSVSYCSYTLYKWKYPVKAGNIVLMFWACRKQLSLLKLPPFCLSERRKGWFLYL